MNDAERRCVIARNPCRLTSPPRMTRYVVEQPSVEQVKDVLDLARLRLHELRHFHAFGLVATNAHPKIVQERLGHSSAAFTMQVYGHGSELLRREATEKFASFMDA